MSAAQPRESFATTLWRITTDCTAVGEPVTWTKLADAALANGVTHHATHGPNRSRLLAATLEEGRAEQAREHPDAPIDFAALAAYATAHGWIAKPPVALDRTSVQTRANDRVAARRRRARARADVA